MSCDLKDSLTEAMKSAMRAKDKARLGIVRLALAAIKQIEVDERIELDDTRTLAVLDKMVKQRRDSIEQYQKAERQDLVDQEQFEIGVIQEFLPQALSEQEIAEMITAAITSVGASSMRDMGTVMTELRPKMQGRADMAVVSQILKKSLS